MVSLSNREGRARWVVGLAATLAFFVLAMPAEAATIANRVAKFSGLDKITGRITNFDVYIDETVQFGALQITPRACYTRPPTETQRVSVFVEVDQVSLQKTVRRIFTGWMFADSPALNAIDHAVYDIWLTECKQQSDVPPPQQLNVPTEAAQAPPPATDATPTGSIPEEAPEDEETPPVPDTPADTPSFTTLPQAQPDTFAAPRQ